MAPALLAWLVLFALTLAIGHPAARAAAVTWAGATTGTQDWFVAANWQPARVPGIDDDVRIDGQVASLTVVVRSSTTVRSLSNGATLRAIGTLGSFTTIEAVVGITNRGEIRLETERSDRWSQLLVRKGGEIVNQGSIVAIAANEGRRLLTGSLLNRGSVRSEKNMILEIGNVDGVLLQVAGTIQADGAMFVTGGRVRLEGGTVSGDIRLFGPDLSVGDAIGANGRVSVLGISRLRGNASTTFTVRATADLGNFTVLAVDTNSVNAGRIVLDSDRSDRASRLECPGGLRNEATGTIEIVPGAGGDRAINGNLLNLGKVLCTEYDARFTGTYEAAGGVVDGNVSFINAIVIPTAATPQPTELKLYGSDTTLKGDNPQNLRLRVISDIGFNATLYVGSNIVNNGEIHLESLRSDRSTQLRIPNATAMINRGLIRVVGTNGGNRVLRGSLDNRGNLDIDGGVSLTVENTGGNFIQRTGRLRSVGGMDVFLGEFRLLGGTVTGPVRCYDVLHSAAGSMTEPAVIDVFGTSSSLAFNDSAFVTYHLTSDLGHFTTLRLLPGAMNRGRIVQGAGRSDRDTRVIFSSFNTNLITGVIDIQTEAGAGRFLEGSLVNQGRVISSNTPSVFTGVYQSDGGTVEGDLVFENSTIVQSRDVAQPMNLYLRGSGSALATDNLPNHRLHVVADLGNFSALTFGSNVVNHGFISLDTLRPDRFPALKALDGFVRNGPGGIIHLDAANGGLREIAGALQNEGIIRMESYLRLTLNGANHRNSGAILAASNTLEIRGATFLNQPGGHIVGAGTLDVRAVAFSNAGFLHVAPSAGRWQVLGNFTQTAAGTLDLALLGTQGPGTGHDWIEVTQGKATLAGRLGVRLLGGFVPNADASFRVVGSSSPVEGRFDRLSTVQVLTNRFLEVAYRGATVDVIARSGTGTNQPPSIVLDPQPLEVAPDSPATFRVIVDGTGPLQFQWRLNGNPINGATADTYSIPRAALANLGDYDVVVANARGSATSRRAGLKFTPSPKYLELVCDNCDFGDAPDSYGTNLTSDGARHPNEAPNGPYVGLGAVVDVELTNPGSSTSRLDDNLPAGKPDDEDGVLFTTPILTGAFNEVRVVVRKSSYEFAWLNAWMDMDGDGRFGAGDDHIIPTTELHSGLNILQYWVPADAVVGPTFSRFRLVGSNERNDPNRNVGPTGTANNGEVEDHPVTITRNNSTGGGGGEDPTPFDFGDNPDSYGTTLAADGARHTSDFGKAGNPAYILMGQIVDLENDGQPDAAAALDDLATATKADDEDGVFLASALRVGQPATVLVVVKSQGFTTRFLNAWIDFDHNGNFTNLTDRIASGIVLAEGTNTLSVVVPPTALPGSTHARFRITGANDPNAAIRNIGPTGAAGNGEVEDYLVNIEEVTRDYGDAPETQQGAIATTSARGGPSHIIVQGIYLGKRVDAELDGKPSAQARGDDNAGVDDEDGVVVNGPLTPGGTVTFDVTASVDGYLEGWIDFNGNRSWADAGENVFNSIPVLSGVNSLVLQVPNTAVLGDIFARFRFSTRGGYGLTGEASNGEVEDYKLTVEQPDECELACTGSDFWLAYPGNQFPDPAFPLLAQLRILGTAGNTVNVDIPGLSWSTVATIGANGVANVVLPNGVDLGALNDGVLNRGIHVTTTGKAVQVYAVSRVKYSSDGYLGLPTPVVGTEYVVGAYPNLHVGIPELSGSQFVITATQPNTTVTITPSYETGVRVARVPYQLVLTNAGDCYQLRNTNDAPADLTGTIVQSDLPVAVFGGHQCTDVNSSSLFYCDYLVEQIPPVNRLGTEFFTAPFATRTGGDTLRVVASRDLTTLTVDGSIVVLTNKGDVYTSLRTGPSWVTANKPVYAAQFASSSDLDHVTNSDPFMVTVPGRSLFTAEHTFVTAGTNFPAHYINIVAPSTISSFTLDGSVTNPPMTDIGTSGFRYAQIQVSQGIHTLTATRPIGVTVYGWGEYESYAWPACLFFGDTVAPVLAVPTNRVTRGLPANENTCVVTLPDLRQAVTVTDNCQMPLDVIITQTPPAGTSLGVGTNQVTLSTRDSAGNLGTTVVDYVVTDSHGGNDYTLKCPDAVLAQCDSEQGGVVNFTVTGLKGCTPVVVETVPPSGSFFPIGATEVVSRILENGVVKAECRFPVTVACSRRAVLKLLPKLPGGANVAELQLDFDPGSTVEVSDTIGGPWAVVPNATPGMKVPVSNVSVRFYRIR